MSAIELKGERAPETAPEVNSKHTVSFLQDHLKSYGDDRLSIGSRTSMEHVNGVLHFGVMESVTRIERRSVGEVEDQRAIESDQHQAESIDIDVSNHGTERDRTEVKKM